jgi:hypothetical protein
MPAIVPLTAVRDLAARLEAVQGRARAAIKRDFSSAYGCSSSTLSRLLNEVGCRSHERIDRGVRRKQVEDEVLNQVAAIQRASLSLRKGVVMPAEDAIMIAEDSERIERGLVTPNYYNAWLRERESSRSDQAKPQPHTELRSLGPNHVHQVDFSLAVNWKIFQGRPIYEHLIYKNKLPSAGTPRLFRLIVTDHTSGCIYPHYTQSTGETVQALWEGMFHAWTEKRIGTESLKDKYPFRGVPRILMADRGSANQAGITATLLERLDVRLIICEGARSKGSVETAHNWWEEHFESRLRLQQPECVEQINEWATDFAARLCATKTHSRMEATRSAIWAWHINRRTESQLRELKCDFETFKTIALSEPQKCRVSGARIIRFRSQKYRVPEQFLPGEYVAVQYSPFSFPQIQVRAADVSSAPAWLCEPVQLDEFGFQADSPVIGVDFRAQKKTDTARFVDAADAQAKEFVDAQQLRVFGHHRDALETIPVRHTGSDVLEPAAVQAQMTKIQAREATRDALGRPFVPAEVEYINSVFGDGVTEAEVAAAVEQILAGVHARLIEFRRVAAQ